MLKDAITYLNLKLTSLGYFNSVLCLAEKIDREGKIYPAIYNGGNEYKAIDLDPNGSVCYWRKNGDVTLNEEDNNTLSCSIQYKSTFPLKLVGFIKKDEAHNDQYFSDNIIASIIGNLTNNSAILKTALKAKKVSITATKYNTDGKSVGKEEYENVDYEPRYTHAYFSIDFNLVVTTNKQCFADICTDEPFDFSAIVPAQTFCEKVNSCIGISEEGDEQLFLNEKGEFVPAGSAEGLTCENILDCEAITDLNNAISQEITDRENAIAGLLAGVATPGDTLAKLYSLILSQLSEATVANIAARNAYNIPSLPYQIFVVDDGDGNWALYKATTTGVNATYVKLTDFDLFNAAMSASAIKISYESNPDTNAFTDALLAKLNAIVEIKQRPADQSISTNAQTAITGLTFSLDANSEYEIDGHIHNGCNATGGILFSATVPALTTFWISLLGRTTSNTANVYQQIVSSGVAHTTAFSRQNAQNGSVRVKGTITTGATSGNFVLKYASAINGQTSSIYKEGSIITLKKL